MSAIFQTRCTPAVWAPKQFRAVPPSRTINKFIPCRSSQAAGKLVSDCVPEVFAVTNVTERAEL